MTPTQMGLVGLAALLLLLALRMPVGIAMLFVGFVGFGLTSGWAPALALIGSEPFAIGTNYDLIVIPLFVLMGNLASVLGMSRELYAAAYAWVGRWPGGLASATVVACSIFGGLTGSSVADAVTIGQIALPEMRRYNYNPRLAAGAVAAGGTLGILIPPSTGFIVYAILTEESIGRLFLAGVLPGLLLTALFILTIYIQARIHPKLAPSGPAVHFNAKVKATWQAGPIIAIIILTIGGIYAGIFTPTEAASVGAFLAFLLALFRRRLTVESLWSVLLQSVRTTAFVFLILVGAFIFSPFLALTHIASDLAEVLIGLNLSRYSILLIIVVAYIIMGMFLEGFAMMVLTLPIVHPLIVKLGFDPIWFGVVMVILLEMGLISPPVGVNVYVVKGIAGDVPMSEIFIGILPFWIAMGVGLLILVLFPQIALLLPSTMIE